MFNKNIEIPASKLAVMIIYWLVSRLSLIFEEIENARSR